MAAVAPDPNPERGWAGGVTQLRIPGTRGGWPAELAEAYTTLTGGVMSPGRIGRTLKPILVRLEGQTEGHWTGYGARDLLVFGFCQWARSPERRYGVGYFAANFADYVRGPGI